MRYRSASHPIYIGTESVPTPTENGSTANHPADAQVHGAWLSTARASSRG
jgi:hypothetical protein